MKLRPPFTLHESESAFWLVDASGTRFAFTYWTDTPIVGTGADKPSRQVARQLTVQVQRLPELIERMSETTNVLISRLSADERAALTKFRESLPEDPGEGEAARMLIRDQLIAMGDLPLGTANRGKGNLK